MSNDILRDTANKSSVKEPTPLSNETPSSSEADKAQADILIAEGSKAIALKQWEDGAAKYADALEIMSKVVGDTHPSMAPLLLSYGKALYEIAFSSQGVMGQGGSENVAQSSDVEEEDDGPVGGNGKFVFEEAVLEGGGDDGSEDEGDAAGVTENGQEKGDGEGVAGPSNGGVEGGEGGAAGEVEGGGEEVDEPEDDYNAAWEVLDLARQIYSKVVEGKEGEEAREERLSLAECYDCLGDVSLETENFPQAVLDYTSSLSIKTKLLPPSSRELASVHYRLATVLEFTPNRRDDSLLHVQSALSAFKQRKSLLQSPTSQPEDEVSKMSDEEKARELSDVEALIGDLESKIEELKTAPVMGGDLVSQGIQHLLGGESGDSFGEGSGSRFGGLGKKGEEDEKPVNDLTSMVKKKAPKKVKAVVTENGNGNGNGNGKEVENGEKRKAEEPVESGAEKKAKID